MVQTYYKGYSVENVFKDAAGGVAAARCGGAGSAELTSSRDLRGSIPSRLSVYPSYRGKLYMSLYSYIQLYINLYIRRIPNTWSALAWQTCQANINRLLPRGRVGHSAAWPALVGRHQRLRRGQLDALLQDRQPQRALRTLRLVVRLPDPVG